MNYRITATLLSDFYSCPVKAYNYAHNYEENKTVSELARLIMDRGLEFEQQVIEPYNPVEPEYDFHDPAEGFNKTLALMEKGVPAISQPVFYRKEGKFEYIARPDLLEKVNLDSGMSAFGKYYYRLNEIKHSPQVKPSHVIQLGFSVFLSNRIQQITDRENRIILYDEKIETFHYNEFQYFIKNLVEEIKKTITNTAPPMFTSRLMCHDCSWQEVCFECAEKIDSAGLIFNIPEKDACILQQNDIRTLQDILDKQKVLKNIPELSTRQRVNMANRAFALKNKKPLSTISHSGIRITDSPVFLHIEKDYGVNKNILSFTAYKPEISEIIHKSDKDPQKVIAHLEDFLGGVILENIITSTEHVKKILKEEIIFPLRIGGNRTTEIINIQKLLSLEGLIAKVLCLDLYIYDFHSLCKYFGLENEEIPEPEYLYLKHGPGDEYTEANRKIILMANELFQKAMEVI